MRASDRGSRGLAAVQENREEHPGSIGRAVRVGTTVQRVINWHRKDMNLCYFVSVSSSSSSNECYCLFTLSKFIRIFVTISNKCYKNSTNKYCNKRFEFLSGNSSCKIWYSRAVSIS